MQASIFHGKFKGFVVLAQYLDGLKSLIKKIKNRGCRAMVGYIVVLFLQMDSLVLNILVRSLYVEIS